MSDNLRHALVQASIDIANNDMRGDRCVDCGHPITARCHDLSSESGERDREAAVVAMANSLETLWDVPDHLDADGTDNGWPVVADALLQVLDANPEAAATLAAYLRGASPATGEGLREALHSALQSGFVVLDCRQPGAVRMGDWAAADALAPLIAARLRSHE